MVIGHLESGRWMNRNYSAHSQVFAGQTISITRIDNNMAGNFMYYDLE